MSWPKEALYAVAERLLSDVPLAHENHRVGLIEMCSTVHTSSKVMGAEFLSLYQRHVYTTPKSYLDLISLYISMLSEKRKELQDTKEKMEVRSHCRNAFHCNNESTCRLELAN